MSVINVMKTSFVCCRHRGVRCHVINNNDYEIIIKRTIIN